MITYVHIFIGFIIGLFIVISVLTWQKATYKQKYLSEMIKRKKDLLEIWALKYQMETGCCEEVAVIHAEKKAIQLEIDLEKRG